MKFIEVIAKTLKCVIDIPQAAHFVLFQQSAEGYKVGFCGF